MSWSPSSRCAAAARRGELHKAKVGANDRVPSPHWLSAVAALAGAGFLVARAELLVAGSISLARIAGLSETVIALTIIAIGTPLSEFVACLVAALKGGADVAFGNIVGSNIYNILGILGITAIVAAIPFPPDMVYQDWIALVAAVLLVVHARTVPESAKRKAL